MIADREAKIVENRHVSGRMYLMVLEEPYIARNSKAGNFVMLEVSKTYDPMGRRAFAIGDIRDNRIYIFYDVVGRGTKLMSKMKEGERVKILGPLGKRLFSKDGKKHLLIGGGVGLAGLSLLGKELRNEGKEVIFVYGGRNKEHLGMEFWLKEEGFNYILFTDDGSKGRKGYVTEVIKEFSKDWIIHACGPKPMLKAIKRIIKETGHKAYLSLEESMACGWGVCLGCVVKGVNGKFLRVCYEGPVFPAEEVVL